MPKIPLQLQRRSTAGEQPGTLQAASTVGKRKKRRLKTLLAFPVKSKTSFEIQLWLSVTDNTNVLLSDLNVPSASQLPFRLSF